MRLFLLSILFSLFAFPALACNVYGGELGDCARTMGSLPTGHAIPPGNYRSAATFILRGAGCIHPEANFGFHSAFKCAGSECAQDPHSKKFLDANGNRFQMRAFAQYPALQRELSRRGAFGSLGLTYFSGSEVSALTGIPLCN